MGTLPTVASPIVHENRTMTQQFREFLNKNAGPNEFRSVVIVTDDYEVRHEDHAVVVNSPTSKDVTLPTSEGRRGQEYVIKNIGAGSVTVHGSVDGSLSRLLGQYGFVRVISIDSDGWTEV